MSETIQELTQQYNARTQAALAALSAQLASAKDGTPNKDVVDKLAAEVARLRKDHTDAISFLPTYDQRQFDQHFKDIEREIETLRASLAPKTKFAFKRKAPSKPPSSSPAPQSTSQSTPSASSAPSALSSAALTTGLFIAGHTHKYLSLSSLSAPWTGPSDLTISDLDHCIVNLVPSDANPAYTDALRLTALHVRNLSHTVLILPIIEGSALLHDLNNCVIAMGSHQFRMHTSSCVDVYISIGSNPIIEHCTGIRFADYPTALRRSSPTETQPEMSKFLAVQDFSHIRATPSPNWCALPDGAAVQDEAWPLQPPGHVDTALVQLFAPR